MFNLGIKQIIINSDAVVTEVLRTLGGGTPTTGDAGNSIVIEGYGTFIVPLVADIHANNFSQVAIPAALGIYDYAAPIPAAVGNIFDVRVYIKSERTLGELWSYNTDFQTFQVRTTAATAADFVDKLVAGQIAGFNDKIMKFSDNGDNFKITFQPGYEGVEVFKVTVTEYAEASSNVLSSEVPLVQNSIDTAPEVGTNTGKVLEAEVRNATFENIDPYGIAFGGNSAVDVRALYTEYHWVTAEDHEAGWEPHEMLGYGDANTTNAYAPRQYSAFCNEASATAAGGLINALVVGGGITA